VKKRSQIEELTARADRQARRLGRQAKALRALEDRVATLEDELNDARAQGRRTGELADAVISLLVHESARRDPEFRRIVGGLVREL
jgi:ABC-type transporter Mla subunit MlaD